MNKNVREMSEQKFDQILKVKIDELRKNYEATLRKELATVAQKYESLNVILTMIEHIDGKPTNIAFEIYEHLCNGTGITPMCNIEFSRFVVKWFDFVIVNKKIEGVKYRIFIKAYNEEVQDEPKSSRSVQDAVQDETQ